MAGMFSSVMFPVVLFVIATQCVRGQSTDWQIVQNEREGQELLAEIQHFLSDDLPANIKVR